MKISQQLAFRPALPVVLNNSDYQRRERELKRMSELLEASGIEEEFARAVLEQWLQESAPSEVAGDQIRRQQERARRALRCMVLVSWLGLSYREMSVRLAECPLYQWFCRLDRLGEIRVPSKSEVGRFLQMGQSDLLKKLNQRLVKLAAQEPEEQNGQALELKNQIELDTVWLDSTAIKSHIHYPTDWVLLGDATRTLMKATALIRKHGLKRRMVEPDQFIRRMNKLCMEMSAARRRVDGKRKRKRVFRLMKKLVKTVRNHAWRHRDLLELNWEQTDWSHKQAMQVAGRIDNVLLKLPEAIDQAHARIIRAEAIENERKILSLYEADVNVIVRGKPEAEIEFGNSLLLAEQKDGLIVDWQMHRQSAPNDSRLLRPCMERMEAAYGQGVIAAVGADRQFDSKPNRQWLGERDIYNGVCPRSSKELKDKSKSAKFQAVQRRRAQTEARIAILKNDFLDGRPNRRGFENREKQVGWSVLSHNLWLLARLEQAETESGAEPLALAA